MAKIFEPEKPAEVAPWGSLTFGTPVRYKGKLCMVAEGGLISYETGREVSSNTFDNVMVLPSGYKFTVEV